MTRNAYLGIDKNYNGVTFLIIILTVIGVFWLFNKGVLSGKIYFSLFLFGVGSLFLIALWFKEKDFDIPIPVASSNDQAVGRLILGILFTLSLFLILSAGSFIKNYSLAFAPINSFSLNSVDKESQSFASLVLQTDPGWFVWINGITAPGLEEPILGFIMVSVGFLLTYILMSMFNINFENNRLAFFIGAFVFSGILFMGLHLFNDTYVGNNPQLFTAFGVRIVLNVLIYIGLGLEFAIGAHGSNNFIDMFINLGVLPAGFFTLPGAIVLFIVVGLALYAITRFKSVWEETFTIESSI